jgi:hypothetical protein
VQGGSIALARILQIPLELHLEKEKGGRGRGRRGTLADDGRLEQPCALAELHLRLPVWSCDAV